MPWVLEDLGTQQRPNVLDVGPAMPQTVELLHSTGCRLSVADLLDSGIVEQQRQLDSDSLTAHFKEALWMLDGPLHVCLFWDFLNYLSPQALEAFNQALKPWVTRNTRAHAFCATKRSAPLMQHRYDVRSVREVVQTRAPERPLADYPPPWRQVVHTFSLFEVVRGTLRTGGVVELILRGTESQSVKTLKEQAGGDAVGDRIQVRSPETATRHRKSTGQARTRPSQQRPARLAQAVG